MGAAGDGGIARRAGVGSDDPEDGARALDAGRTVTIGDVIALLRPEFPDVTISKIRFLEDQGLVTPDRTPSGYRKFGLADVDRLRHVLTLQRDHYLPLRVIRDVLGTGGPDDGAGPGHRGGSGGGLVVLGGGRPDGGGRRGGPTGPTGPTGRGPGGPGEQGEAPRTRRDREWLEVAGGADGVPATDVVTELLEHGLVDPARDGRYDADDLETVRAAVELARHGLRPRHLRLVRAAAEREADLVDGVVGSRRPARGSRADTGRAGDVEARREVAAALLRLHAALVAGRLR
ncbi:MAG: MerR family transcriptional regulator [Kineosporiaceae bacterium]